MFGRRLSLALVCLALAALLQGALAWWAIESASAQVTRGRVASDLVKGHWQLAASKQRLRSWTSQALLLPNANTAERDAHISDMRKTLASLQALTQKALALDTDVARAQRDWRDRQDTLAILRHSVDELDVALRTVRPLPADADPAATWDAFKRTFDTSQGQDLREHVRQTIDREQAAEMRERNAADRALLQLAGGVLLATLAIALLAAALALYFAQALRRPLNNLNSGAQALQRGELHHRMDERGSDEFAAVAHTLNTMTVELQQHRERETQARHELERQVNARTAELQEALHALQAVDASRRQLFADISHELRTPTTAIRGEAEIALRGPTKTSDDYQDSLRRIVDIAAQLGQVIDDLLTMARSDAQALWVQTQALPVAAPVNEALLQLQALAQERQISVVWENRASPDLTLWCDGTRLRQLLVLLLDNAIRYSNESAQVTLHTSTDGKAWHAHVVDQGIGIPADELPRVFERHFRGEQARRHRADGVGLGLSLALALTEAHGGTLDMASVPGQGTTGQLELAPEAKRERMNILVIEDDRRVADFLERGLRAEGHVVHVARNGPDGLALAQRAHRERQSADPPTVVLLDVMLPGLSGLEVCQSLRAARVGLPILMLTALGTVEDRVAGLRLGADDYLPKPFAFEELLARIDALARRAHSEPLVKAEALQVDDLLLDLTTMRARRGDQALDLTARELALLELLMRHPGRLFSRERILANVWGTHEDPLTNVVDVYIRRLRSKIDEGQGRALIHTVRGLGYRLE